MCERFEFFSKLRSMKPSNLLCSATNLVNIYSEDLKKSLGDELFFSLIVFINSRQKKYGRKKMVGIFFFRILFENNLKVNFHSNIEIALRLYL